MSKSSSQQKTREPLLIRLLPGQRQRIEAAVQHVGGSMNQFICEAAMTRAKEIEEEIHVELRRAKEMKDKTGVFAPKTPSLPAWAKSSSREEDHEPVVMQTTAPTVVVHAGGSSGDIVDRLAAHVLSAPNTIEREERERLVTKFLKEIVPEGEREGLARALDEKIAAKAGKTESPMKKVASWLTGGR